eukprot:scaffold41175_cov72-Phaeocystis_antarctica.AAC.4
MGVPSRYAAIRASASAMDAAASVCPVVRPSHKESLPHDESPAAEATCTWPRLCAAMCSYSRCTSCAWSAAEVAEATDVGAGPLAPGRRAQMASCCSRPLPSTEHSLPQCRQGPTPPARTPNGKTNRSSWRCEPRQSTCCRQRSAHDDPQHTGRREPVAGCTRAVAPDRSREVACRLRSRCSSCSCCLSLAVAALRRLQKKTLTSSHLPHGLRLVRAHSATPRPPGRPPRPPPARSCSRRAADQAIARHPEILAAVHFNLDRGHTDRRLERGKELLLAPIGALGALLRRLLHALLTPLRRQPPSHRRLHFGVVFSALRGGV